MTRLARNPRRGQATGAPEIVKRALDTSEYALRPSSNQVERFAARWLARKYGLRPQRAMLVCSLAGLGIGRAA